MRSEATGRGVGNNNYQFHVKFKKHKAMRLIDKKIESL